MQTIKKIHFLQHKNNCQDFEKQKFDIVAAATDINR